MQQRTVEGDTFDSVSDLKMASGERSRGFFKSPADRGEEDKQPKGFFKLQPGQTYDEAGSSAVTGLVFYSALMFTVPLLTFYGTKAILEEEFDADPPWNLLFPAILSIASVNIIIVLYVYKAFQENKRESERDAAARKND